MFVFLNYLSAVSLIKFYCLTDLFLKIICHEVCFVSLILKKNVLKNQKNFFFYFVHAISVCVLWMTYFVYILGFRVNWGKIYCGIWGMLKNSIFSIRFKNTLSVIDLEVINKFRGIFFFSFWHIKRLHLFLIAEMWTTSFLGKLCHLGFQCTLLSAHCRCCGGSRCMLISIICNSKSVWILCFSFSVNGLMFLYPKLNWDCICFCHTSKLLSKNL